MPPQQVADNPDLLELMLSDINAAPDHFKPTNYWKVYQDRFVPELRSLGLNDFRRRDGSVLASFGAVDMAETAVAVDINRLRYLNNRLFRRIPGWSRLMAGLEEKIRKTLTVHPVFDQHGLDNLVYAFCELTALKTPNAVPLDKLTLSTIGNPEGIFEIDGRTYSQEFLKYYLAYLFACSATDFGKLDTVVELASGAGKQAEVLHKLHPDLTIFLFDIPPQLYVAEQYLSAVFPGDVVSYEETRTWSNWDKVEKSKIHILGNWKFDLLKERQFDLFWSSASLGEMEPDVVRRYLSTVNDSFRHVFLRQSARGKEVADKRGGHGVLEQTTWADYEAALSNFRPVKTEGATTRYGYKSEDYLDGFWSR